MRYQRVVWAFDFETAQNEAGTESEVVAVSWASTKYPDKVWIMGKEKPEQDLLKEFFENLVTQVSKSRYIGRDNKYIMLFAHNGSRFDNKFIREWLIKSGYQMGGLMLKEDDTILEKTFYMLASDQQGILRLIFNIKGYIIDIKDFYKFVNQPLSAIGKMVGVDKLEGFVDCYGKYLWDLSPERKQAYLEYCKTDTKILAKAIAMFSAENNLIVSNKVNTLPGMSYRDFLSHKASFYKKEFAKRKEIVMSYKDQLPNKRHYGGGYTYINPKYVGEKVDNVYYYDINSSYPAVMKTPVATKVITKEEYDALNPLYRTKILKIAIRNIQIKEGCVANLRLFKPTATKIDDGGIVIFTSASFATERKNKTSIYYIWENEWPWIANNYELEYEILEEILIKKELILKDYIVDLEKEKITATKLMEQCKQNNDNDGAITASVKRTIAKLKQNSVYGRFAQREVFFNHLVSDKKIKNSGVLESEMGTFLVANKKGIDINNQHIYNVVDFKSLSTDPDKQQFRINNHLISGYITSQARIALYKQIDYVGYDNFIYCDTDSIFTKVPLREEDIHPEEYGKWKLEGVFYFKGWGPKVYLKSTNKEFPLREGTIVCRGISNPTEGLKRMGVDIEQFKWNDFQRTTVFASTQFKESKTGTIVTKDTIKTPYRLVKK